MLLNVGSGRRCMLTFVAIAFVHLSDCAPLLLSSNLLTVPHTTDSGITDQRFRTPTVDSASELEQAATSLASSWGLGTAFQFAQLADTSVGVDQVLSTLDMYSAVLVVVPGESPPHRSRTEAQEPFLTLEEGKQKEQLSSVLPVSAINKAAAAASSALGKPLYPFRLEVLDFDRSSDQAPWAVYHVPNGIVYLDIRILDNMKELPVNMATHLAELATSLFGHLSDVPIDEQQQAVGGSYLGQIFSAAAAAASLAVASQIPLWFCITCPIVLGMLFPFAFNFGLGAIADELCTYYNLPADECTQLWYSAFALAMILSFASVLPIVSICRLAQCAKNSPSPSM